MSIDCFKMPDVRLNYSAMTEERKGPILGYCEFKRGSVQSESLSNKIVTGD